MEGRRDERASERAPGALLAHVEYLAHVLHLQHVLPLHTHSQSVSRRHRATHAHARRSESDGHGFIQGPRELYRAF